MRALSDQLLASGCASHVEAFHGETIKILSGPDAGKEFIGVVETEQDLIFNGDLGEDRRAKRVVRFREGFAPTITSQATVQTADGKKWTAVRNPGDGFLTTDYELKEIVSGKDS